MNENTSATVGTGLPSEQVSTIGWTEWIAAKASTITNMGIDIILLGHPVPKDDKYAGLAFALACCVISGIIVILDLCIFFMRRKSIFQLKYRLKNGLGFATALCLAAGIVGFLGYSLDIMQPTRAASIAVGIAWPAFLAAFFNTPEALGHAEDIESGGEEL